MLLLGFAWFRLVLFVCSLDCLVLLGFIWFGLFFCSCVIDLAWLCLRVLGFAWFCLVLFGVACSCLCLLEGCSLLLGFASKAKHLEAKAGLGQLKIEFACFC